MCTLSFIPTETGYFLAMNRDEQRSRPQATPPQLHKIANRYAIYPLDVGGGTWIAVDEAGNSWALLNRNATRTYHKLRSRGEVLLRMLAESETELPSAADLQGVLPFRLISVCPRSRQVIEWTWDGAAFERKHHPWHAAHWFSSGKSDSDATAHRGKIFASHLAEHDYASLEWLRRMHCSHEPEPGAFSVCVHRPDAATVSYTEVQVSSSAISMRYTPGSPCSGAAPAEVVLPLATADRAPLRL